MPGFLGSVEPLIILAVNLRDNKARMHGLDGGNQTWMAVELRLIFDWVLTSAGRLWRKDRSSGRSSPLSFGQIDRVSLVRSPTPRSQMGLHDVKDLRGMREAPNSHLSSNGATYV